MKIKSKLHRFQVPLNYYGTNYYIVEAVSKSGAEAKARARFFNGENGDLPHCEQEEIDWVGKIEKI